jgi:CheY-like chemotaxis protein
MSRLKRVLVVEDDATTRDMLTRLFLYHSVHVVASSNGEEVLGILKHFTPDIIIIDLALPGMDGWTLLNHLKGQQKLAHVPMVAITAFHTDALKREAGDVGFDAYYSKPLNVNSLPAELEQLLLRPGNERSSAIP